MLVWCYKSWHLFVGGGCVVTPPLDPDTSIKVSVCNSSVCLLDGGGGDEPKVWSIPQPPNNTHEPKAIIK